MKTDGETNNFQYGHGLQICEEISKNYDWLVSYSLSNNDDKLCLEDNKNRCCRFCGKSFPDVSFREKAHIIPEFMGNKKLFSKYECDDCNHYFSKFETEFAEFMLLHNSLSGTRSKKNKIPKYKKIGQPIMENTPELTNITNVHNMDINNIEKKGLNIPFNRSYIPEYIYRCLVKIAISIIPENKLDSYKDTISWLMDLKKESNVPPSMIFSNYPFSYKMEEIFCTILERKESCTENFPFSIFFLSYNNFGFQIYIPNTSKEFLGKEINGVPFYVPMSLDLNPTYFESRVNIYTDLSLRQKKTDVVIFNFSSEHYKIIDN